MSQQLDGELRVARADLVRIVAQLVRANRKAQRSAALFTYDGRTLHIDITGMRLGLPAIGTWRQAVRVDALVLSGLRGLPAAEKEVIIRLVGSWLSFNDLSIPCDLVDAAAMPIPVPLSVPVEEGRSTKDTEPESSPAPAGTGILTRAFTAMRECAIDDALRHLHMYGVTRADLEELVTRRRKRASGR